MRFTSLQLFKPLDFLVQMPQHIPDKYQNVVTAVTRSSVRLKVGDRTLMPMRLKDLPEDLRTVLDVMKPVLQRTRQAARNIVIHFFL